MEEGLVLQCHRPLLSIGKGSHIISFYDCKFSDNKANYGGALAISVPIYGIVQHHKINITFYNCSFISNEAQMGTAVDVNGRLKSERLFHSATASIVFHHCHFINNVAAVLSSESQINAVMLVFNVAVEFMGNVTFINNTATALYLVNSNAVFSFNSIIKFMNNTGDKGGAIYISDYS